MLFGWSARLGFSAFSHFLSSNVQVIQVQVVQVQLLKVGLLMLLHCYLNYHLFDSPVEAQQKIIFEGGENNCEKFLKLKEALLEAAADFEQMTSLTQGWSSLVSPILAAFQTEWRTCEGD